MGHFDPRTKQPFSYIWPGVIGSTYHLATARKLVQESIVLLKNTQVVRGGQAVTVVSR